MFGISDMQPTKRVETQSLGTIAVADALTPDGWGDWNTRV